MTPRRRLPYRCLALLALLAAAEARAADPACDPAVEQALVGHAMRGAAAEVEVIRDPASGIAEPPSIVDFACGHALLSYRPYDIFFDPADAIAGIMDLGTAAICEAAARAYREALRRPLPRGAFRPAGGGG